MHLVGVLSRRQNSGGTKQGPRTYEAHEQTRMKHDSSSTQTASKTGKELKEPD